MSMHGLERDDRSRWTAPADERGLVLVVALWILVLLAVMGASAAMVTRTDLEISGNARRDNEAFYLAEAGLQRALGMINSDIFWYDDLLPDYGIDPSVNAFDGSNTFGTGSYTVQVFQDDPLPNNYRVISTGSVTGTNSSAMIEAVLTTVSYNPTTFATFGCGNLNLMSSGANIITGNVYSNNQLQVGNVGSPTVLTGDAYALNQLSIAGPSQVAGDASSNWTMTLSGSLNPNVTGVATAPAFGGAGTAGSTVIGSIVPDLCTPDQLANTLITLDDMAEYAAHADVTHGNWQLSGNQNDALGNNIIYVNGNLRVMNSCSPCTYSGNPVIVVNGNVNIQGTWNPNNPGVDTLIILIMADTNFQISSDTILTGYIQVGGYSRDGLTVVGQNVVIQASANLVMNGSIVTPSGVINSNNAGSLTLTYQDLNNDNLRPRYGIGQWRAL
jgi:hypothetical protein